MKRAGKILVSVIVATGMISGIAYLAYIAYREITVRMALAEAHLPATKKTKQVQSDPEPLTRLRPHPFSSPLHNRQFDETIAGARAAYDAGDYDRAIILNTEALQFHPSDDLVWLLLTRRGNCYLGKNEPDKALADYDAAARLSGLDSRSYVSRAWALRREGRREDAIKDFEAAIAVNPNDAQAYASRAAAYVEDKNLGGALIDYEKALELDPRNVNSRLGYAEAYLRQNENQKAITQSTIALKIDSDSARGYVIRARAYAQLHMDTRARGDLKEWKHWRCIDTLAAAYAEAGDFDQAIKYQKQALQMTPAQSDDTQHQNQRLQQYEHHQPYRDK
jgi:tetratricopeptide (TPR) repeat protein